MPQLYARVFLQILDSSLADDWQTRHVFEDLLKLCNQDGVVDMTREAISRRTNTPQSVVDRALEMLEAADPRSRDPEESGRRIVRLDDHRDWGWRIVNFQKYDIIRANSDLRAWNAVRMAHYRANRKTPPTPPKEPPVPRTDVPPSPGVCPTCSTTDVNVVQHVVLHKPTNGKPSPQANISAFNRFWDAYPRALNRADTERAFVEVHGVDNLEAILSALKWQCSLPDWKRDNGQYIPSSANYLRDHRWEDKNTNPADLARRREYDRQNEITRKLCAQPLPE